MQFARRPLRRASLLFLLVFLSSSLFAAEKPRIDVTNYVIDAEIIPRMHKLVGKAKVTFTALDDISVATFELNNALRPTKVEDANGKPLTAERVTQDYTIHIPLPDGLAKGQSTTLTIEYEGTLNSADDSPVQGVKLASVGDDTAYLLYAGRWFPMVGYGLDRFTATMNIKVPTNWTVIGSGTSGSNASAAPAQSEAEAQAPALKRRGKRAKEEPAKAAAPVAGNSDEKTVSYTWDKPAFPGTIIAGTYMEGKSNIAGIDLTVYYKPDRSGAVSNIEQTAGREFQFYSSLWGAPMTHSLKVVELPDDTISAAWSTEIAALASRTMAGKLNYRLLANTIAHQWWGSSVSPAIKDDWWLSDGLSRYAEARYVEEAAGQAAYEEVIKDMEVGALAYDTVPISGLSRLDIFSPQFQSLATDKGAVIMNMLRWVIGDDAFHKTLANYAQQYQGKSAGLDAFKTIAEQAYGDKLNWFFIQWIDSTGAPEFKVKYTVYRLGGQSACNDPTKCKGFRVVGQIAQDLDLFRMPVEVKVDTDGKSETQRIEVVGTDSAFAIETFGRPRKITIDPNNAVLKNSPDLKLRASILRGQGLVQQGDLAQALQEFQKALDSNKNSSLAHYRIAEVFFLQHNYQAAANAYRDALNGDGEPRWTEVWSHIQLGKIFDITGQRERATNEYRQAVQTGDDTQGAQTEAHKYLQAPYEPKRNSNGY